MSVCGHAFARVATKGGAKVAGVTKAAALGNLSRAVIARLQEFFGVLDAQAIEILLGRYAVALGKEAAEVGGADVRAPRHLFNGQGRI